MKNFLLYLGYFFCGLAIIGVGITGYLVFSNSKKHVKSTKEKYKDRIEVITVDSCEYVFGPWGSGAILTHKGNCKNPIHKK
jgi:hypothetical protein